MEDLAGVPAHADISGHPARFAVQMIHSYDLLDDDLEERMEEKSERLEAIRRGEPVPGSFAFDEKAREQLSWTYPHHEVTQIRTKQSVSEIKRKREYEDEYRPYAWQSLSLPLSGLFSS